MIIFYTYTANPFPVMKTGFPCVDISALLSLQGSSFHYRESCYHCRDPVFITGISLPVPCSILYGIAESQSSKVFLK